MILWQHGLT